MIESQATITTWQDATFGPTTLVWAYQRLVKEWNELRDAMAAGYYDKVRDECPDVLITLYRVAQVLEIDLHAAVDAKMVVNRAREWVVDPATGHGQHK